jgi:hypothetical protein
VVAKAVIRFVDSGGIVDHRHLKFIFIIVYVPVNCYLPYATFDFWFMI